VNDEPGQATTELLSAYLDGELDETTHCRTRKRLLTDAHARRRLEDYRLQDEHVREALRATLTEPVPERLARLVQHAHTQDTEIAGTP